MFKHPAYSPDLAKYELFLFPKLKSLLKGTRFQSFEGIHKKTTELLKEISQNDFRRYFKTWKTGTVHYVASNGNYFERDKM
jgi:hypothetical protein